MRDCYSKNMNIIHIISKKLIDIFKKKIVKILKTHIIYKRVYIIYLTFKLFLSRRIERIVSGVLNYPD